MADGEREGGKEEKEGWRCRVTGGVGGGGGCAGCGGCTGFGGGEGCATGGRGLAAITSAMVVKARVSMFSTIRQSPACCATCGL